MSIRISHARRYVASATERNTKAKCQLPRDLQHLVGIHVNIVASFFFSYVFGGYHVIDVRVLTSMFGTLLALSFESCGTLINI